MLPKVFLHSTFLDGLASWREPDRDVAREDQNFEVWDWWKHERASFNIFAWDEDLRRTNLAQAPESAIIQSLSTSVEAFALHEQLLIRDAFAPSKSSSAMALAIAAVNEIKFLIAFDYGGLNRATKWRLMEQVCADTQLSAPIVCIPQTLRPNVPPYYGPILEEIYRHRDKHAKRFNDDVHAIVADIQSHTAGTKR